MFTRQQLDTIEDQSLAPYGIRSKDSKGRAHPEGESGYRTAFQRDRDRLDAYVPRRERRRRRRLAYGEACADRRFT